MKGLRNILVIGDGGAFDTEKTNSSFLINENVLFDCGYNVFAKLREYEKNDDMFIRRINHIVISHIDDDHMGSLKSLLYYRYFIHGLSTEVICGLEVEEYLSNINKKMESLHLSRQIVHLAFKSCVETSSTHRFINRLQSCMLVSHTIGYNYKIPLQFDYPI